MRVDVLIAEIGSTTTIVNAFNGLNGYDPVFVGFGAATTTVSEGDVQIGLINAMEDLRRNLGVDGLDYDRFLASSSAAGGLRMTAHGLIYDMTAKAGREAALGAGANIQLTTAGKLTPDDLAEIEAIDPNLILLAGGTDYGDRETALFNAKALCGTNIHAPVIYCGNVQNHAAIRNIFDNAGRKLYITENVYPKLDDLNVEPARKLIHQAFEEHITKAPGMAGVRNLVDGAILPTPGAVMECANLLYNLIGDLVVIDIGGATTDIHSVTAGSEEIAILQTSPEPPAKRTVEGDLGMYVNARNLAEMVGFDKLADEIKMPITPIFEDYQPVPQSPGQLALVHRLAYHAAAMAISRHAGVLRHTYGPRGRQTHAQGKDLTAVRHIVATGGALTRLPRRHSIMAEICNINASGTILFPKAPQLQILEDSCYIMASLGVLAKAHPQAASKLLQKYVVVTRL
ncbi:MAG: GlmL-related ornithine degradation protein [Defluviitaleaceae bacterium]|nr:GlmL-related ornithine degradation protein [Defluviitaleaceae bacterium]